MAGVKITDLPAAPVALLTDVFPVDQLPGPITYKESNLQLLTLFQANGAALTESNDTNVTLTLGGSFATALLNPASITAGWTGQLSLARGGTNAALTASNGGILWSNASQLQILAGTATANLPLLSGSTATPAWGAFALSLGGAFTTAGALTTSGAYGVTFTFTNTTSLTFPVSGTLATTSQSFIWAANSSNAINAAANVGSVCTFSGSTTITLPASGAIVVGALYGIAGQGGAWTANIAASTSIVAFGNTYTTSIASTNSTDILILIGVTTSQFGIIGFTSTGLTAS